MVRALEGLGCHCLLPASGGSARNQLSRGVGHGLWRAQGLGCPHDCAMASDAAAPSTVCWAVLLRRVCACSQGPRLGLEPGSGGGGGGRLRGSATGGGISPQSAASWHGGPSAHSAGWHAGLGRQPRGGEGGGALPPSFRASLGGAAGVRFGLEGELQQAYSSPDLPPRRPAHLLGAPLGSEELHSECAVRVWGGVRVGQARLLGAPLGSEQLHSECMVRALRVTCRPQRAQKHSGTAAAAAERAWRQSKSAASERLNPHAATSQPRFARASCRRQPDVGREPAPDARPAPALPRPPAPARRRLQRGHRRRRPRHAAAAAASTSWRRRRCRRRRHPRRFAQQFGERLVRVGVPGGGGGAVATSGGAAPPAAAESREHARGGVPPLPGWGGVRGGGRAAARECGAGASQCGALVVV